MLPASAKAPGFRFHPKAIRIIRDAFGQEAVDYCRSIPVRIRPRGDFSAYVRTDGGHYFMFTFHRPGHEWITQVHEMSHAVTLRRYRSRWSQMTVTLAETIAWYPLAWHQARLSERRALQHERLSADNPFVEIRTAASLAVDGRRFPVWQLLDKLVIETCKLSSRI